MAKKSTKADKSIYQLKREELNLTRFQVEDRMISIDAPAITADRLEKLENGRTKITAYDALKLAEAYNCPELCNYFCKNDCDIGHNYDLVLEVNELPRITLELIAKLNAANPLINRLIDIAYNGEISDDEIPDFAKIKVILDQVSLATNALDLWVEKSINDNELNSYLFYSEIEKIKATL